GVELQRIAAANFKAIEDAIAVAVGVGQIGAERNLIVVGQEVVIGVDRAAVIAWRERIGARPEPLSVAVHAPGIRIDLVVEFISIGIVVVRIRAIGDLVVVADSLPVRIGLQRIRPPEQNLLSVSEG